MPEPVLSGGKSNLRDSALQDLFLTNTLCGRRDRFSNNENQFRCCESVGERWCDGAGGLLTLGFRSYRCLHARLAWDGDGTEFSTVEKR